MMAFISTKLIKGKNRYYLEKSIRLPDGKVKKVSIYLADYSPNKKKELLNKHNALLDSKLNKELADWAISHYKKSSIFSDITLKRLEEIRTSYKEITKNLSPKQWEDVIDRFTVNFTYESNAIEGNSLTLKDVTMILHEKKAVKGKDLREIYETLNTREAMELVFNKQFAVNEQDIIKLHNILVKDTGVAAGYKQFPNFLVGRDVETTPPEKIQEAMKNLIAWYNNTKNLHPLQKAAIFHAKFEKIHPFEDGNGRTGRLLINIILLNHNYPPLIIRKTQRLSYFSALEAFDKNHEDKLFRFVIEKYKDTYEKFFQIYLKYL